MPRKTKTTPRTQTPPSPPEGGDGQEPVLHPGTELKEVTTRTRRQKPEEPEAIIEQELLDHPERMNYLLLLAFLKKHDGRIEFKPQDIDINDEDWNVAFARSLDGKRIVVSIVSVQSGILKTPQKEQQTWEQQQRHPENPNGILPFRPMPNAHAGDGQLPESSRSELLTAAQTAQTPEEKMLQEHDTKRKMHATPFMVGDRPETAGMMMDLGALTREDRISRQVGEEEAAAAARVEAEQQ